MDVKEFENAEFELTVFFTPWNWGRSVWWTDIFAFLGGVALVLLGLSWRRGREKERSKKRKKLKKQ